MTSAGDGRRPAPPRLAGGFEAAVEGLWARFRDVALGIRRLESFNFLADEPAEARVAGTLDELLADERRLGEVGRETVLRALRVGADPENFRILRHLWERDDVNLAELAQLTALPRLVISERVDDLVQAGLAGRILERDAASLTRAGRALVELVGEVEAHLIARIRERLPALLESS